MEQNDEKFMQIAIDEAKKGQYKTWKDPLVGAVIVKDDNIIAKGYHQEFGSKHAVEEAINRLSENQLENSTLYITMEPCNDCLDLITKSKFSRVVIAQSNPELAEDDKNTVAVALQANTNVTKGVLAKEASQINKFYNYYKKTGRPWITIKQSLSLDHHVSPANGKYIRLTNEKVHEFIHHERADYQALVIGSSTAIIDNPNLLTDVDMPHPPIRVIVDRRGRLLNNPGLNLLNYDKCETWIFTQNLNLSKMDLNSHVHVFNLETDGIDEIIDKLASEGIQSMYVEGGPTLEKAFMDNDEVNQIVDYFSPIYFGGIGLDGAVPVHQFELENIDVQKIDDDIRITGDVKKEDQPAVVTMMAQY